MAAPRKTTQPINTNSGDTTPQTKDEQARVDHTAAALTTEDVVLAKEAGGHKAGATITVTHGAAEYLREQGYVEGDETDED